MNFLTEKVNLAKSKLNFLITKKELISLVYLIINICKVHCALEI